MTNTGRPPLLLTTLIPLTILLAACGGSSSPAADASLGASVSPAASGAPSASSPPTASVGGGAGVGIPAIADGTYKSGTAHVEISGGRSDRFDASAAGGITSGGSTVLVLTSADNQKIVHLSFLAPGESSRGGLAVTSSAYSLAAEWGQECQLNITRNNASGLSGQFSCTDAPAVAGVPDLKVNVTGTFSAER